MSRFFTGLAALWVIGWLMLLVIGFAMSAPYGGPTFGRGSAVAIPVVLLGPPLFLLALAWLFAPRK